MEKPFKILCIDGGGIKGLYSASVLAKLEQQAGKLAGECFDMICGTSTGGLIALGIATGKPTSELVALYAEHGNKIFPTANSRLGRFFQRSLYQTIKQITFFGKFSNKVLKERLVEAFGTKTLGQLDNLVCIPSFSLVKGMPRVFKYPHKEGNFFMDRNVPIVDAALATSAAPTYLPIHGYDNDLFVDGGIWANNPSLCGLTEALQYFVGDGKEYTTVHILSVPSVSQPSGWLSSARKSRSFVGWKSKLFQASMDGQAYFTHFFLDRTLRQTMPDAKYLRLDSPNLSKQQMKVIDMDRTDSGALGTLKSLGDHHGHTYACRPEVMAFFQTNKTYQVR